VSVAGADIVVVGGGIAGLTTALLLARVGASITLLERSPAPGHDGTGIVLQPNGLAVMTGLGLDSPLHRHGCASGRLAVYGAGSRAIVDTRVADFGRALDHHLAVRRRVVHDALLGAVARDSTIACRLGAEVTRCTIDGVVESVWHGRSSTIQADLVIGADGIDSVVRRAGNFGARVRRSGRSYVRGLVPRAGAPLAADYWTALGLFGGTAVDADTVYFRAASHERAVAWAIASADVAALALQWAAVLPLAGEIVGRLPATAGLDHADAVRVDCERWDDRRIVLVGDAAHAMDPATDQGVNTALVDVAVLVAELAVPGTSADAVRRYTTRRSTVVRAVQDRADLIGRISAMRGRAACVARDRTLRTVSSPGRATRRQRADQQEQPAQLLETVESLGY
jgi:2-polyprenyl-6-methoxyphenol hydroxylase-like FAD-dependent oxidoreductase